MRGRYCCKEQCPAEIRVRFCYGKGKHQRGHYRRARTWTCRCDQRHGFRAGARHVRPAIRKIEWAAGQGAFVGKMAGKIRYSGTMATKYISPRRLRRSARSRGGSRTMWPSLTSNTARRPVPRLGGGPTCWAGSAKSRKNGPFHASHPCGAARRKSPRWRRHAPFPLAVS